MVRTHCASAVWTKALRSNSLKSPGHSTAMALAPAFVVGPSVAVSPAALQVERTAYAVAVVARSAVVASSFVFQTPGMSCEWDWGCKMREVPAQKASSN